MLHFTQSSRPSPLDKRHFILMCCWIVLVECNQGKIEAKSPPHPAETQSSARIDSSDLRWMLLNDLQIDVPEKAPREIWQAANEVLRRQQAAMKTLQSKGGDVLAAKLDRHVEMQKQKLRRTGTHLAELAKQHAVAPDSITGSWRWKFAWNEYLRSHLTDENLERFFNRHAARYGAKRFQIIQLVIPIESLPFNDAKKQIQEALERSQTDQNAAEQFATLAETFDSAGPRPTSIWIERPGDLPSSLFHELAKQTHPGLLPPVATPLGTHVLWVQQIVDQDFGYESLTDRSSLVHDASEALFENLVAQGLKRSNENPSP